MNFEARNIDKLEIKDKNGKEAFLIFPTLKKQDEYTKAERKFCKQTYIDYCSAFTKVAREQTKEALETQRRLFAETQQYVPSKTSPKYWIFKTNMENIRA